MDSERRAGNEIAMIWKTYFAFSLTNYISYFLHFGKKQHIFSKFSKYELYFPNLFKFFHNLGYTTKTHHLTITIIVDPWHNPPSHEGSSQEQCRWKKEMISNNMAKPFILSTILTHLSIANVWNVAVIGTLIDKWWWF